MFVFRKDLKMPRAARKPPAKKPTVKDTKFQIGVYTSACLVVGKALHNLTKKAGRDSYVDGFMQKLYIDCEGDLVAEADCGNKCWVAGTKDQMKQIRDFLTAILDEK